MKILLVMLHYGYLRYYRDTIMLLAKRGHRVHLGLNISQLSGKNVSLNVAEQISREHSRIAYSAAPVRKDIWSSFARGVRGMQDYLRYFDPIYENSPKLKRRIARHIPAVFRVAVNKFVRNGKNYSLTQNLIGLLKILEKAIPCDRRICRFIQQIKPDVVLVSPLIDFASYQVDYVKNAKHLGIRNALCVGSWDNLTNKGSIRIQPDNVIVWNEIQKDEAINLHQIVPSSVVVTGAQVFDEWFERKPSTSREEFCNAVGLDPEKPFFLYLCSSPFIASSNESGFVEEWIRRIRSSHDETLKRAGILIRPHPINTKQWEDADFSHYGNVVIWPRKGAVPTDENSKTEFFDSLYHCKAAVGINTSAMIEAGIIGRPVYTILAPEFSNTQEGTIHFRYLAEGGFLSVSRNFDEHMVQLSKAVEDSKESADKIKEFIKTFIRPHGIDKPCVPILADIIESLGTSDPKSPEKSPIWVYPLRLVLLPFVFIAILVGKKHKSR